jgi:hypothetical protein
MPDSTEVIAGLQRRLRCLTLLLLLVLAGVIGALTSRSLRGGEQKVPLVSEDTVLRVRGLVMVDENGIERVRIEAPFIAPMLFGKRYRRNGDMGGILMFDGDGNERSGYGTSNGPGAVLFTLDTLSGDAAHFTAYDEGGVDLWLSESGNRVRLAATEKGPSISASQNGTVVFEQPQKKEGDR